MGELVWDDRLLSRARALELVGRWPVVLVHHAGEGSIHVRCAAPPHGDGRKACFQSVGRILADYRTSLEELLAGVLRHAVTAHELDAGERGNGGGPRHPEGAAAGGRHPGRRGGADPARRPQHQAGAPRRGRRAPGGDAA